MRIATTCALLVALLTVAACNKTPPTPTPSPSGPPPGFGPPGGPPGMGGGMASPIRDHMVKLAKGPQSLIPAIGTGLQAEAPDWADLGTKSKEAFTLASEMAKHEPRRGSKESWTKHTTILSEMLAMLDKTVQEKKKAEATEAHQTVSGSCKSCHDEHRGGPGGKGGKGGFGGKKGGPPVSP